MRFKKALTIGSTGMLKEALRHVMEEAEETWTVSRQAEAFSEELSAPGLVPINADYADPIAFTATLRSSVKFDDIDLALLWMHDVGNKACLSILDALSRKPVLIVHVVGSASGDPDRQAAKVAAKISFSEDSIYCPVVLGAMADGDGRRWLTHKEISAAAIKAIKTGVPQMAGRALADFD